MRNETILIRVKPEIKAELTRLAKSEHRSLSNFMSIAIDQILETKNNS